MELAAALDALLLGASAHDEAAARAAIAAAFPRASATLGLLLRLETLQLARDGHGATSLRLAVRLQPAGLRATAPRYAAFLDKYLTPIRTRTVATDATGATWWTLEGESNLWTLRLRARGGSLVPLEGDAQRRIPERLRVTSDYSTRMGRFSIAARGLVAEVALIRTPVEKGFVAHFQRKPDWELPFLVESLLGEPAQLSVRRARVRGRLVGRVRAHGNALRAALPRARRRELGAALARRHDEPGALRVPRGRRARGRPVSRRVPARAAGRPGRVAVHSGERTNGQRRTDNGQGYGEPTATDSLGCRGGG